uniref:Carboxylic ester hydrolase n=1 Tax=Ciona intestinalis TaxID=7719 RepID=F6UTQ2_CIOIN
KVNTHDVISVSSAVGGWLLCALYSFINSIYLTELNVKTLYGWVEGTTRRALESNRDVYSFFGIPYARSPDYTFRFRPPVDPWVWEGVKDTTNQNVPFCSQDPVLLKNLRQDTWFSYVIDANNTMKEDCLTVNVFSPTKPSKVQQTKKLPVLVWIHGGGLSFTATTNKLWMLPAFEDVVVVTIQYRLGVFGFLTLEDNWAPGNTGLLDQVKALEWVRDNIQAFGGDPEKVTIFGQSSGGFSVSAHMLSPRSRGLFHRAFAMSGVAILPYNDPEFSKKNPAADALKLAEKLGCEFWDNAHTSTCLRNHVTTSEMLAATKSLQMRFGTNIDVDFFPDFPRHRLTANAFNKSIPLMLGVVSGEMDFILGEKMIPNYNKVSSHTPKSAESLIRNDLAKYHPQLKNPDRIVREYLTNIKPGIDTVKAESDYLTDSWYTSKLVTVANAHKGAGGTVYMYEFTKQPSLNQGLKPRPVDFKRADHCDDMIFFQGIPFLPGLKERGLTFTQGEKDLSRKLMNLLANFARNGSPNSIGSVSWPQYPEYVLINDTMSVHSGFREQKVKLFFEN